MGEVNRYFEYSLQSVIHAYIVKSSNQIYTGLSMFQFKFKYFGWLMYCYFRFTDFLEICKKLLFIYLHK